MLRLLLQALEQYKHLLASTVLHDLDSQDWVSVKPYYNSETGRLSPCIQFWSFQLQGWRSDFFNILPPLMGQNMLALILEDSLGLLVVRYTSRIHPSSARRSQFVADVTALLLTSHDLLLSILPSQHFSDVVETDLLSLFRSEASQLIRFETLNRPLFLVKSIVQGVRLRE